MAKRKKRQPREKAATVDYTDPEGNALSLRETAQPGDDPQDRRAAAERRGLARRRLARRSEALFERLVVSWEIAGLPLEDQKMLLGRYRMADAETQRWVRETISRHLEQPIPELAG